MIQTKRKKNMRGNCGGLWDQQMRYSAPERQNPPNYYQNLPALRENFFTSAHFQNVFKFQGQ